MSKHDSPVSRNSLVDTLAVWLEENGYMVATCLEEQEYQKPPPLNGHKPDVYALKRGTPSVIGIVELCDRLRDELTRQRWSALFAVTTRAASDPGSELYIMVPSNCLKEAKRQATAWGVTATFHTERLANQLDTAEGHE